MVMQRAGRAACVAFTALAVMAAAPLAQAKCPNPVKAKGADLSLQVTDGFLKTLKAAGVRTVARYYDYPDETLPGKTLTQPEVDLIAARGMSIVVIFQHHNDHFDSFTPARGDGDATRALELAARFGQPAGSAIYFGVDGDWESDAEQAKIQAYFEAAHAKIAAAGYRVGVYGSGLTCKNLKAAGLVSLCWLPGAMLEGLDWALENDAWQLWQQKPSLCGGVDVDMDRINKWQPDAGQWKPTPSVSPPASPP
jgi:hypothetical protein